MAIGMEGACAVSSWNTQVSRTGYGATVAAGSSDDASPAARRYDGVARRYNSLSTFVEKLHWCGHGVGRGEERPWHEGWRQGSGNGAGASGRERYWRWHRVRTLLVHEEAVSIAFVGCCGILEWALNLSWAKIFCPVHFYLWLD